MDTELKIVPTKTTRVKNFAVRHKTKFVITALAITTAGTAMMIRNQKAFNEFLDEKGLKDEYYFVPEDTNAA